LIVVDASAALEILLQTATGLRAAELAFSHVERMHAPCLIDIEVTQVLSRLTAGAALGERRAQQALTDFSGLLIERHDHGVLLPRIWQLRESLGACEATYLALAEALDAPLLTCDAKLARARGHRALIMAIR